MAEHAGDHGAGQPKDALWEHVCGQYAAVPYVPTVDFMVRIGDIGTLYTTMVHLYQAHGKPHLALQMNEGMHLISLDFVRNFAAKKGITVDQAQRDMQALIASSTTIKLAQLESRIVNQALVAACTVLDEFLCRTVDAIARAKREILYGSNFAKQLSLEAVIGTGSIDSLVDNVRAKEVLRFSHMSIEKKYRYFFDHGLTEARLFDSAVFDPTANPRIGTWGLARLGACAVEIDRTLV